MSVRLTRRNSSPSTPVDAVVSRESFVEEGKVRVQKFEHTAVFPHDRPGELAVSCNIASRNGSSNVGKSLWIRFDLLRLRNCSHCPIKLSNSASAFGSSSIRRLPPPARAARSVALGLPVRRGDRPACCSRGNTKDAWRARIDPNRELHRRSGSSASNSIRNRNLGEVSTADQRQRHALRIADPGVTFVRVQLP